MTQKIPLPLKTETTLLLGLPVGDAAVACGGIAFAAYSAVGSGWHAWGLGAGILAATLALLLRYQEEPTWSWLARWFQYWVLSPRCFTVAAEARSGDDTMKGGGARVFLRRGL